MQRQQLLMGFKWVSSPILFNSSIGSTYNIEEQPTVVPPPILSASPTNNNIHIHININMSDTYYY